MNILPFLTIILLTLAIYSQSITNQYKAITYRYICFSGYMKAENIARNEIEIDRFMRVKRLSKQKSKGGTSKQETRLERESKPTRRELEVYSDKAKCNLFPLFDDAFPHSKMLKQLVLNVWTEVYPFAEEKQFEQLLLSLCKNGKKRLSILESVTWRDLYPKNPTLRKLYYKMLKGTNSYSFKHPKGYPPLDDLYVIDDTRKALIFDVANFIHIKGLFGSEIAEKIQLVERKIKKEKPRSKKNSFLAKNLPSLIQDFTQYESLLNLSSSKWEKPPKQIVGEDSNSQIHVKKRI